MEAGLIIAFAWHMAKLIGFWSLVYAIVKWLRRRYPDVPKPKPIQWPKGGDYYLNPAQTSSERFLTLAALSPQGAENMLKNLGFHTLFERERRKLLAAATVPVGEAPPIVFREGEPQWFSEYVGQNHIIDWYQETVPNVPADEDMYPHQLFCGPAGLGKTTIVKVFAMEWQQRARRLGKPIPPFLQLVGSDIKTPEELDAYIRRAEQVPGTVLFLDEIHALDYGVYGDKLLMLLDEHRYLGKGDLYPRKLKPFIVLAATTDYEKLHPAFKRRFELRLLTRMSREELLDVVVNRPFPITTDAANEIVRFTHWDGVPWQALRLRSMAERLCKVRGKAMIDSEELDKVVNTEKLDDFGLRPPERDCIFALLKCPSTPKGATKPVYKASLATLVGMTGIPKGAIEDEFQPRLQARRLLVVGPGGRMLTDLAVQRYSNAA